MHRRLTYSAALAAFLVALSSAHAQYDANRDVRLQVSPKGISKYVPGRWGLVELTVTNVSDKEASPISVSWFKDDVNLEFSRQLRIPPRSTRRSWYPIFVPDTVATRQRRRENPFIELQTNTRAIVDGQEVVIRGDSFDRVDSLPFKLSRNRDVTLLNGRSSRQRELERTLEGLFTDRKGKDTLVIMNDPLLPATVEGYDVSEVIIVSDDAVTHDASALSALNAWVMRGGTLWMMLDHLSPQAVDQIAGDAFTVDVVEEVQLTQFEITSEGRTIAPKPERRQLERPVEFLRTFVDGATILHAVDGWPAAFWTRMGKGRVFCTTLALEGWHVPQGWNVKETMTPNDFPFQGSKFLDEMMIEIFDSKLEQAVSEETQRSWADDRIGVEIPSRGMVLSFLAGFLALLISLVAVLRRLGRLEAAGLMIPVLTIAIVMGLGVVGAASRSEPETLAEFQVVSIAPGQPLAHVEGVAATYTTDTKQGPFDESSDSIYLPDRSVSGMGTWRREQKESDRWRFTKAELPPGVRLTRFERSQRLQSEVSVQGTFDETGFVGTIHGGEFGEVTDLTVAGRTHFTASPQADGEGRFRITSDDILPPGEFLSGRLLNDEQQQRQVILQRILTVENREVWYPQELILLGWAQTESLNVKLPVAKTVSTTLLNIPIVIREPEAGAKVTIPSLFLTMDAIRGAKGEGLSSAYKNSHGTWATDKRDPGVSVMRFTIPTELRSMKIESATVKIRILAPHRHVELFAGAPGQRVSFAARDSMVGEFEYTTTDAEALNLDDHGSLQIGIDVGDVTIEPDDDNIDETGEVIVQRDQSWEVNWLQLEVQGQMPASE